MDDGYSTVWSGCLHPNDTQVQSMPSELQVWRSGYSGERPHCVEHHKLMVCVHDAENTVLSYACGWIWWCHPLGVLLYEGHPAQGRGAPMMTQTPIWTSASRPLTLTRAAGCDSHLDKRVDYTDVGTGIEDLVEARLSVDQLQLVELLVILQKRRHAPPLDDQTVTPCMGKQGFNVQSGESFTDDTDTAVHIYWNCEVNCRSNCNVSWGISVICDHTTGSLLTTSFLTSASLSVTISLSSAMICRSSGRLSRFLNFSSVPSNLDTDRTCGRKSRKICDKVDNITTKRVNKAKSNSFLPADITKRWLQDFFFSCSCSSKAQHQRLHPPFVWLTIFVEQRSCLWGPPGPCWSQPAWFVFLCDGPQSAPPGPSRVSLKGLVRGPCSRDGPHSSINHDATLRQTTCNDSITLSKDNMTRCKDNINACKDKIS